ncbi:MAG TPA: alkaline phosphatase, partial [Candidatus Limnocylindria bacterium]
VGWWHVIAINSICQYVGSCRERSKQMRWLRADLNAHAARCTLAYWHHPRFSSGDGASRRRTSWMWQALYAAGADVVLNGHDHDYERFAPLDPDGHPDAARGIRQFVVGTGGAHLTDRLRVARNSEIWTNKYHGVLELTLRRLGYSWRFTAAETGEVIDSGSGRCH